jgi:hypothetical protein
MSTAGNIRAGGAFVELTVDDIQFVKGLDRAQSRLKFFGRAVTTHFIGRSLKRMSEEIVDVQKKLADGSLESGQGTAAFGDAIASNIPVLGNYYTTVKNVIMVLDGTVTATIEAQQAMEKMNREVAVMHKMREASKAMEALTKSIQEYGQELQDATELENAPSDADRERLRIAIDYRKELAKANELKAKAEAMPLSTSKDDHYRRAKALEEADKDRVKAAGLYADRMANWQKRQDASAGEEVQRIIEENDRLTAEHFDFVKSLENRLHDLRIDAIEDEDDRALEAIKVRYDREQDAIRKNGRTEAEQAEELAASEAARQQEVGNFFSGMNARLQRQQEERIAEQRRHESELRNLDDQIAAASDAANVNLTDQQRQLRAIDRQEAAAMADAEVGGAVPLDVGERLAKLAEFQRAAVNRGEEAIGSSAGAFSGAALQSLQGGAISAAEETAENTAALVKSTSELIREVRKKGQFFL